MGSISTRPTLPSTVPRPVLEKGHHNLIECYAALIVLSGVGEMTLKRTKKTWTISLDDAGKRVSFRGKSMCAALKGLVEKVDKAWGGELNSLCRLDECASRKD